MAKNKVTITKKTRSRQEEADPLHSLALSLKRIAVALEGLRDAAQKTTDRLWPEREQREAVVTRIPTEEDKLREQQGASDKPIRDWLGDDFGGQSEDEFIGERERAFLESRRGAGNQGAKDSTGSPKAGNQPGTT